MRRIPLERELGFVTAAPAFGAIIGQVLGPPMFGHNSCVPESMSRDVKATKTVESFIKSAEGRNKWLQSRCKSSGDPELDMVVHEKSMEETRSGILIGPFNTLAGVPTVNPFVVGTPARAPRLHLAHQNHHQGN